LKRFLVLYLQPIHDEPGYQRRVALINSLLDVAGNDEDHALSGQLARVSDLVSRYAREHDPRNISGPMAAKLGKLFGVSPALFVSRQTNNREITRFG
jgi:hypothetical protein